MFARRIFLHTIYMFQDESMIFQFVYFYGAIRDLLEICPRCGCGQKWLGYIASSSPPEKAGSIKQPSQMKFYVFLPECSQDQKGFDE
jgi:hypothetical protein